MKNYLRTILLSATVIASIFVATTFSVALAAGAPTISTVPATGITSNSATLRGYFSSNGSTTSTWLEYSTSANLSPLAGTTAPQSQSGTSGPFSEVVTGLQPGQSYYFRAGGVNANGSNYGTIYHFTTLSTGGTGTGTTTGGGSCTVNYFKLNGVNGNTSVALGATPTISWDTSNCTDAFLTGGGIYSNTPMPVDNSFQISPAAPGNYTFTLKVSGGNSVTTVRVLTVTGGGGTGTGTTTGGTGSLNCVIDSFSAYSVQVNEGNSTTLGWGTSNCTSVSISPSIGSVTLDGSHSTGALYATTTFTLYATGVNGTITATKVVNVIPTPQYCTVTYFSVSPTTITAGQPVTLTWNMSSGCTNASISGGGLTGTIQTNGSVTATPGSTATFTVTGYGSGGWTDYESRTVTVQQQQQNQNSCAITAFYPMQTSIAYGTSTNLVWQTNGYCSSAYVSGNNVWGSGVNGTIGTGSLTNNATYTITAYGTGGSVSSSTSVSVSGNPVYQPPTYYPPNYPPYIPPATASCYITNFYASPSTVTVNGSTTLTWNTNCNTASITGINGVGTATTVPGSGSINSGILSSGNHTFILTGYGSNGIATTSGLSVNAHGVVNTGPVSYACSDTYDNDADGLTDANDPGCRNSTDTSEYNSTTTVSTSTSTGTTSVNGLSITAGANQNQTPTDTRSNIGGLALFSGINLPSSFVGWLILVLVLGAIILIARSILGYAPPVTGNKGNGGGHH